MGARLFRVFIPVTDYDAAVKYYSALFADGGRMIHRGRHYFDVGSVIIAVIENDGSPISDHLYFAVPDIENYFDRSSALGGLEEDSVHGSPSGEIHVRPWGERSFYCRDPFGNGLCFVDETTLFTGSR